MKALLLLALLFCSVADARVERMLDTMNDRRPWFSNPPPGTEDLKIEPMQEEPEVSFKCEKGVIVSVEITHMDGFATDHIRFSLPHDQCPDSKMAKEK